MVIMMNPLCAFSIITRNLWSGLKEVVRSSHISLPLAKPISRSL